MPVNSNTERTLGIILGKLEGIESRLTRQDESRAKLHSRTDEIARQITGIESDLAPIRKDVADAKAVTDEVRRWKLMGLGALGVVGLGGTALGVALASSLEWIARLFRGAG